MFHTSILHVLASSLPGKVSRVKIFVSKRSILNSITDSERADKAAIAVERINGPILLISVGDDAWWPSSLFTNMIVKRLQEHRFPYEVKRLDYAGAGHSLSVPYVPTTLLQFNGGTPKINAAAIEDAWRNILAFLSQNFD